MVLKVEKVVFEKYIVISLSGKFQHLSECGGDYFGLKWLSHHSKNMNMIRHRFSQHLLTKFGQHLLTKSCLMDRMATIFEGFIYLKHFCAMNIRVVEFYLIICLQVNFYLINLKQEGACFSS